MTTYFVSCLYDEFKRNNLQITGFYPYTTVVRNAIVKSEFISFNHLEESSELDQWLLKLWNLIESKFSELGISTDNKVAVRLQFGVLSLTSRIETGVFYVGWYDNRVSIGLSVDCEDMGSRGIKYFPYQYTQEHLENYIRGGLREAGWRVDEIHWNPEDHETEDCENRVEVKAVRFTKLGIYAQRLLDKLTLDLLQNFNVELVLI